MSTTVIDLSILDGSNGFRLDGEDGYDLSGYSVSGAGDVNGDGFDDVIVGAIRADDSNGEDSGSSYVVFGKASGFDTQMDLSSLNGRNGFRLDGEHKDDQSGFSVSDAGDVNGMGLVMSLLALIEPIPMERYLARVMWYSVRPRASMHI